MSPDDYEQEIERLSAENARLKDDSWHKELVEGREMLRAEVARLSDHIRAIAEWHEIERAAAVRGNRDASEKLHTERRDFALSGLSTNVYQSTDELVAKEKS